MTSHTAFRRRRPPAPKLAFALLAAALCVALSAPAALAIGNGGTVRPVPGVIAPWVTPTLPDPNFSVAPTKIHGFDMTGFVQSATADADNSRCPDVADQSRWGGTAVINGITIQVPCNMVIQMPANTLTWAQFVKGKDPVMLTISPGSAGFPSLMPSVELRVVGNVVDGQDRAGLMFASQQSVNTAFGQITKIDYDTGDLIIQSDGSAKPAVVEINDPKGRFGRAQSPDDRFSVDDANPTIHAGTGYPMCVPRTDPANAPDPLCPQQNRPKVNSGQAHGGCRNFTDGNLPVPVSGDLSAPADGQTYCTQFVMPAPPQAGASTDGPDARQQAPFEVGDWVTYSGTLTPPDAKHADPYISAHTIIDDVGIYTESLTQPAYISIDAVGVGTADPNARATGTLIDQEAVDRIFLEASTTDVETPVDAYLMDVDPKTGAVSHRWITPMAMTGRAPSGGINTQLLGPQPQRIRLRAPRAPIGLLSQPTRTIQVVQRSLCMPDDQSKSSRVDDCLNNAPTVANGLVAGQYFAPIFDFIFPENIRPGDPPVAYDFWHLPFLRYGEGADHASGIGPSVGPLEPAPW